MSDFLERKYHYRTTAFMKVDKWRSYLPICETSEDHVFKYVGRVESHLPIYGQSQDPFDQFEGRVYIPSTNVYTVKLYFVLL
jgi:hypothetical protein